MADITLFHGGDMCARFTRGKGTVVTAAAGTQYLAMIHLTRSQRRPSRRRLVMTGFTSIGGGDVRGGTATGNNTVVTCQAVADEIGMVDRDAQPGRRTMAYIAFFISGYMTRRFALRDTAVMAGTAHAYDLAVIHPARRHRRPGGGCFVVTGLARIAAGDVAHGFAAGIDTVVTTQAIARERSVIDDRGQPCGGAVANTALIGGGNMGCRFAARLNVVMARGTNAKHCRMIHGGRGQRRPQGRSRLMAGLTCLFGIDVCRRPAAGGGIVVAIDARTDGLRMIHPVVGHGLP